MLLILVRDSLAVPQYNALHCTLHCTVHYAALHTTLHCTLHCTVHYTALYTTLHTTLLCTLLCKLYSVLKLHTVFFYCTQCIHHCTVLSTQYTVYTRLHCVVCTVHNTALWSVHWPTADTKTCCQQCQLCGPTTALDCTILHYTSTALHCTSLHCTALHCTSLHCTAHHCTALT